MPGASFSDVYVRIWYAWHANDREQARAIFSRLLLMINLDAVIPGTRQYIMKRRGVFKSTVSRRQKKNLSAHAIDEIVFCFEGLKPYLKVSGVIGPFKPHAPWTGAGGLLIRFRRDPDRLIPQKVICGS